MSALTVEKPVDAIVVSPISTVEKPEEPLYTVVFNDGIKDVYKCKVKLGLLKLVPHFANALDSGMKEAIDKSFLVKAVFITKERAQGYMQHLQWRYKGCAGPDPIATADMYIAALAEMLLDDDFFMYKFPGGEFTIKPYRNVLMNPDETWSVFQKWEKRYGGIDTIKLPAEIYITQEKAFEALAEKIIDMSRDVHTLRPIIEKREQYLQCSMSELMWSETEFKFEYEGTGGVSVNNNHITFDLEPARRYNGVPRDDFPFGLPHMVYEAVATDYIESIISQRVVPHRRLALFVKTQPVIARVLWKDNAEMVCTVLGVAKKYHTAIAKRQFDDVFGYADSFARQHEPKVVVDYMKDQTMVRLKREYDALEVKVNDLRRRCGRRGNTGAIKRGLYARWVVDTYDRTEKPPICILASIDSDYVDPRTLLLDAVEKLEAVNEQWNARMFELSREAERLRQKNARKPVSGIC